MRKSYSKKISVFILACILISLICGCETYNAFKYGNVNMQDVKMMTREENAAATRPVYISAGPVKEELPSCGWESPEIQSEVFEALKGTDSWIRKNLW